MSAPAPERLLRLRAALADGIAGSVPANIALMRALMEACAPAELDEALANIRQDSGARHTPDEARRLETVAGLWRQHPGAWATVRQVVASADHAAFSGGSAGDVVARWAETFDRLAEAAPDAGMALYALGDPDLLARATVEVVERLHGWGVLGPARDAVEIGCGNGRFVRALAPSLRSVAGVDISAKLIEEARRRCAGLTNVRLEHTSGRDLAPLDDGSADLVLAVDVFPYLVLGGEALVGANLAEAARVLRPGGRAIILNYSYRGDPVLDRADLSRVAGCCGLGVRRIAQGDFSLWDGCTFDLEKPL